ncbi:hypothetical protein [Xenorhabdus thailandensis]|uniref:hypothetical protein n=1 Tax=Xenorhabdus thailandensis TaxID=3136255 RepID=UPI003BF4B215
MVKDKDTARRAIKTIRAGVNWHTSLKQDALLTTWIQHSENGLLILEVVAISPCTALRVKQQQFLLYGIKERLDINKKKVNLLSDQ